MKKGRIAAMPDMAEMKPSAGQIVKLKNRRVALATDGENYLMAFKSLTAERKVAHMRLRVTPEAMYALVGMFLDIRGPLPVGWRWGSDGLLEPDRGAAHAEEGR
jgi:hypothetical protein